MPIGSFYHPFTGSFDGKGHVIQNLNIDPLDIIYDTEEIIDGETTTFDAKSYVGLFAINTGIITNIVLENVTISGTFVDYYGALEVQSSKIYVGSLTGYNSGVIENVKATGSIDVDVEYASIKAGGLVGKDANGAISNIFSSTLVSVATLNDKAIAGGILEETEGADGLYEQLKSSGTVTSYMNGISTIEEQAYAGGIIGIIKGGVIENACSLGDVSSSITGIKSAYAGGIVGAYDTSDFDVSLSNVFSSGNISVVSTTATKVYAGGTLGRYEDKETGHVAILMNALSSSSVTGSTLTSTNVYLGTLVGLFDADENGSAVSNCYYSGSVQMISGKANKTGTYGTVTDLMVITIETMGWDETFWSIIDGVVIFISTVE